jgi:hypothetical protein
MNARLREGFKSSFSVDHPQRVTPAGEADNLVAVLRRHKCPLHPVPLKSQEPRAKSQKPKYQLPITKYQKPMAKG